LTALQTAVDPHSPAFVAAAEAMTAKLAEVETDDTQTDGPQTDDTAGDQP
jgi:hypothetical protein